MSEDIDRPTCKTCPYWDAFDDRDGYKDLPIGHPVRNDDNIMYDCHRHSPSAKNVNSDPQWPVTDGVNWCGEHPDFPAYLAALKQAGAKA